MSKNIHEQVVLYQREILFHFILNLYLYLTIPFAFAMRVLSIYLFLCLDLCWSTYHDFQCQNFINKQKL